MKPEYIITVEDFCAKHNVEISFINSLEQTGLIEITVIDNKGFINAYQLLLLEKFIGFYYDLDINVEGIDTINNLLQRISSMHLEIISLKNRLQLYETNE